MSDDLLGPVPISKTWSLLFKLTGASNIRFLKIFEVVCWSESLCRSRSSAGSVYLDPGYAWYPREVCPIGTACSSGESLMSLDKYFFCGLCSIRYGQSCPNSVRRGSVRGVGTVVCTDCFRMYFRIPTFTGPGTTSGMSVLITAGMHTGDIPFHQLIPWRALIHVVGRRPTCCRQLPAMPSAVIVHGSRASATSTTFVCLEHPPPRSLPSHS
ncbi:hypothetical protein DFH08DRAFT_879003 [Mycena albidolilacea]|uniref:Uncharacterized protein n=1 Tax=Mycena albidolilacea TaxID=1033008 RepID=A0AAD6ZRE5_9AGAR|nr:hypothetical protein DFH08DRAFT_879003 [Mycena albidolilacea]